MNDNNIQSGERLTFYKLLGEKKYAVSIPIVQRDYAQGRDSQGVVRETFLDALDNYLREGEIRWNRDLDFVYGSLDTRGGNAATVIPLDGQQRLTTLFLLHWYLYQISTENDLKKKFKEDVLSKNGKSMFTYETRRSSSDFCNALLANIDDLGEYFAPVQGQGDGVGGKDAGASLSQEIQNRPWFYLSWRYDPTIKSMLTMLDAIHRKFNGKTEYFGRLVRAERPVVTFLFLNLDEFTLTDDLYIKMNSRGKPLTAFENFKAKFEQYIKKNRDGIGEFKHNFGNGAMKVVPPDEYFSHKIDTLWADLFWNYRRLPANTFDNELMNFIRVIFAARYAVSANDFKLETLIRLFEAGENEISFHHYEAELKVLSEDVTVHLINALDALANGTEKIKTLLSGNYRECFKEGEIFEKVLKGGSLTIPERQCFYAYVSFLITNKGDAAGIDQWIRVIHNFTHGDNTYIERNEDFRNAIRAIEELLPRSNDILNRLKEEAPVKSLTRVEQLLEERIKAHLITRGGRWEEKIVEIECHKYFAGQIGFILEFAGIIEYYNAHGNNCGWSDEDDARYFDKFSFYADAAGKVFEGGYGDRKNNKNFVFERAVLTKGDYLTRHASYDTNNLLSVDENKNNINRDHSWKRLLRIDDKYADKRPMVKALFDDPRFNKDDIINSMESICKDKTNTWRDCFISCPKLMEYCKQGFIKINSASDIRLYTKMKGNCTQADMYTYYLYQQCLDSEHVYDSDHDESWRGKPVRVCYNEAVGTDEFEEPFLCIALNGCEVKIDHNTDINYISASVTEKLKEYGIDLVRWRVGYDLYKPS